MGSLELHLPHDLLGLCHQLATQSHANSPSQSFTDNVVTLLAITEQAIGEGSVLHKIEDRWCCNVKAIKLSEEKRTTVNSPSSVIGTEDAVPVGQEEAFIDSDMDDAKRLNLDLSRTSDMDQTEDISPQKKSVDQITVADRSDSLKLLTTRTGLQSSERQKGKKRKGTKQEEVRPAQQMKPRLKAAKVQEGKHRGKVGRPPSNTIKKFACAMCDASFSLAKQMLKHLQEHGNESAVKEFEDRQQKIRGLRVDCPICGEPGYGIRSIKHLQHAHGDHEDLTKLVCDIKLKLDAKEVTRRRSKKQEYKDNGPESFVCQCGRMFHSKSGYQTHAEYRCTQNPNRKQFYYCNICGSGMRSKDVYDKHMLQHQKNKPNYVCDLCGKMYATRPGLLQHSRRDHKIAKVKPIKYKECSICGKSFYDAHKLKKHMTTHTGEITQQCDLCGKGFKLKQHLDYHKNSVHRNKYKYQCNKCGHGVDRLKYLESHICGRVRRRQGPSRDSELHADEKLLEAQAQKNTHQHNIQTLLIAQQDGGVEAASHSHGAVTGIPQPLEIVIMPDTDNYYVVKST